MLRGQGEPGLTSKFFDDRIQSSSRVPIVMPCPTGEKIRARNLPISIDLHGIFIAC